MKRSREPRAPRRPLQFVRLKNTKVVGFTLDVNARRADGSKIVKIVVHNGIFIVGGGLRRRIAGLDVPLLPSGPGVMVRIMPDSRSGSVQVFLDKETNPRFSVIDDTFLSGRVGSFDETGYLASSGWTHSMQSAQLPVRRKFLAGSSAMLICRLRCLVLSLAEGRNLGLDKNDN